MRRFGWLVAVVGLCAVLGLSSASASLMPLASGPLAAGDGTVAPCDADGVTVTYTSSFNTTTADYLTTGVTVANISTGCAGLALKVTVKSSTGASLFEGSATVPVAPATSITIAVPSVRSSTIAGWAVVVTG
jgi:hypothetical protein